jgi:RNA polymerase sigma-70 factor (ECF subfamily)
VASASEADLVARLRQGDVTAFDEAYAAYQPRLYGFVQRLLHSRDLADDLTQETWIRLASHAGRLRPDTQLGAWLFTVARNLTLSFRRWARLDLGGRSRAQLATELAASPLESVAASQTQRRLELALAALPDKYREVLLLIAVEGMAHEAAAAVLGLRPDAFRQRLLRARGMIERHLADESPRASAWAKSRDAASRSEAPPPTRQVKS